MSIPAISEWLKNHRRQTVLGTLFFLVSSISFALGYLASNESERAQIIIENHETAAIVEQVKAAPVPKPAVKKSEPTPASKPDSLPAAAPIEQPPAQAQLVTVEPAPVQPAPTEAPAEQPQSSAPPAMVPVALLSLQIAEVTAGTEANSDDEFIELFNPNPVSVDLTGYSIKKRSSTGAESTLVSASRLNGKSIQALKHFLIVHDGAYHGAVAADATWPGSYDLAYKNNAVVLYDPSGVKVSELSWTELQKGMSNLGVATPQNSAQ